MSKNRIKSPFLTGVLFIYLIVSCYSCKNKTSTPDPVFTNMDLLRGDPILCAGSAFGDVKFSVSCAYDSRKTFDLAIALLHSFEYEEAQRAFVHVIDIDPDCAMAYWGVAMSMYHSLWSPPSETELIKGNKLLKIADGLEKSEQEAKYISAIKAFYTDWENVDHKTRKIRYEKKMTELYNSNKEDVESAVFYALALNSTADPADKEFINQRKAGQLLESLFKDQPNHPGIAHYIIHNYDNPILASKALEVARKYAEIAPSSAHAQHMPSHIFTRLGLWEESIASNIKSAESAVCYASESDMKGHWAQEIHALDYLIYGYLQLGDNTKAQKQYDYLKTMQNIDAATNFAIAYPFAAVPARLALENKRWSDAALLQIHESELNWDKFPWQKAILHFAKSLGASRSGDVVTAKKELEILQTLHQGLADKNDAYKATQVMVQIKTSQAWLAFAKGHQQEALTLMTAAVEIEDNTEKHAVTPGEVLPAKELLGDMYMAMNKPVKALTAFEENLITRPNRFNGLYGAAQAAIKSGNKNKAKKYFSQLIELTESTDSDRKEIIEAKKYIGV